MAISSPQARVVPRSRSSHAQGIRGPVLSMFLLAALLSPSPGAAAAGVVFAADGSAAAVTEALSALGGGGVVVVPPGEWAWEADDQVTVTGDGVTILGAGQEQTLLYRKSSKDNGAFFAARGVRDLRISGMRFRGVELYGNEDKDYGIRLEDATDFRIDHCGFTLLGFAGVRTDGASRGVVDHCLFTETFKPALASHGYGVVVYGTGALSGAPFGGPEATFVEDCEVRLCRHAVTSNKGGRYVFRHNLVRRNTRANAIDALGQEYSSADSVGTEWVEIHDNVVERPTREAGDSALKYAVRIRGGRGLIWNNTFADADEGVRVDEFTPQDTGPVHVWGNVLLRDPRPDSRPDYCANTVAGGDLLCARSAGTDQIKPPADGVPQVFEEAPEGYAPHAYPHPLTTGLRVSAGPARTAVLREGESRLNVALLGAVIPAKDGGAVHSDRWFLDGQELASPPAGDLTLVRGRHLVVRVAEDAAGRIDAAAARIDVVPTFLPISSSEREWTSRWYGPRGGRGEARIRITPAKVRMDGYVTLTGAVEVGAHGDNAMLVRASEAGVFDVRNGDGYAADVSIPYTAGKTYEVRVRFDCDAGTYSVWIDGVALATDYAFRVGTPVLSQVTVWHGHGGLTLEAFSIGP